MDARSEMKLKVLKKQLEEILNFLLSPFYWVLDQSLLFLTMNNEIERILSGFVISDLLIPSSSRNEVQSQPLTWPQMHRLKQRILDDDSFNSSVIFDTSTSCEEVEKVLRTSLKIKPTYSGQLMEFVSRMRILNDHKVSIRELKATEVTTELESHRNLLTKTWNALMESDAPPLEDRKTWRNLGFQSTPVNDFRGTGLLGLKCLCYFATHHQRRARDSLVRSHNPELWFPYSATGINVASWLAEFMEAGLLDCFFDDAEIDPEVAFGVLFSYFFLDFVSFWHLCRPTDIMQFGSISVEFKANARELLTDIDNNGFAHHLTMGGVCNNAHSMLVEIERWIEGKQMPDIRPEEKLC